jgi:hypothetical protein
MVDYGASDRIMGAGFGFVSQVIDPLHFPVCHGEFSNNFFLFRSLWIGFGGIGG